MKKFLIRDDDLTKDRSGHSSNHNDNQNVEYERSISVQNASSSPVNNSRSAQIAPNAWFPEKMVADICAGIGGPLCSTSVLTFLGLIEPAQSAAVALTGWALTSTFAAFIKQRYGAYDSAVGDRSRARALITGAHAIIQLKKHLERGQDIRKDGFFSSDEERSDARALLEAVMIKAQDSFEEKKIPFISNIFFRVATSDQYSASEAYHFVKLAEQTSYRQFLVLRMYYDRGQFKLRSENFESEMIGGDRFCTLAEILELERLGLLDSREATTYGQLAGKQPQEVIPDKIKLTLLGERFCYVLNLRQLETEEMAPISWLG